MRIISHPLVLLLIVASLFGCASGPIDLRERSGYDQKTVMPVREPYPPIKDATLYDLYKRVSLYKRVRNFGAAEWEMREAELYNMIGNQISKETIEYYERLLDMDQYQAVAEFIGPISPQVVSDCRWYKPADQEISYVRGGQCVNGVLEGNAEFTYRSSKNKYYTYWVTMKNGETTKGVFGQSHQLRADPATRIDFGSFHNWNGRGAPNQVEAFGVGYLDRNFNWSGLASQQGDGGLQPLAAVMPRWIS